MALISFKRMGYTLRLILIKTYMFFLELKIVSDSVSMHVQVGVVGLC